MADINENTIAASGGGLGGVFSATTNKGFKQQLNKVYTWYVGGFVAFVVVLAILEQMGLPRNWIGFIFLIATVLLYAGIGVMSRPPTRPSTTSPADGFQPSTTAWRRAPTG
jgi:hypothetical protein